MSKVHKHTWDVDNSNRVFQANGKPAVVKCQGGCGYYIPYSTAVSYKAMKHNRLLVLVTIITAIIALLSLVANIFTTYVAQSYSQHSISNTEHLIDEQNKELKKMNCELKYSNSDSSYRPLDCLL